MLAFARSESQAVRTAYSPNTLGILPHPDSARRADDPFDGTRLHLALPSAPSAQILPRVTTSERVFDKTQDFPKHHVSRISRRPPTKIRQESFFAVYDTTS